MMLKQGSTRDERVQSPSLFHIVHDIILNCCHSIFCFTRLSQSPLKGLDEQKNAEIVLSKEAEAAEMNFSPQDSSYNNDVPDEVSPCQQICLMYL